MAIDHRLLDAVQLALVLEVFDADQLLAVQGRNEGQARVEAAIAHARLAFFVRVQFAHHHGARATVAAGAAFFGAWLANVFAQIVEHGQVRVQGVLATEFLVK